MMRSLIIFLVICALSVSCGFFLGPLFFSSAEQCPDGLCLRHKVIIVTAILLFFIGPAILGEWGKTPEDRKKEREECNKRGIY
jgi:hypothetical protein